MTATPPRPAAGRTFASDGSITTVPIRLQIDDHSEPEIEEVAAVLRWAPRPDGPGILVFDPETGGPLAQLPVPWLRMGYVYPDGWLDDETVLVESYTQRALVSWNYRTGELMRLSTYAARSSTSTTPSTSWRSRDEGDHRPHDGALTQRPAR